MASLKWGDNVEVIQQKINSSLKLLFDRLLGSKKKKLNIVVAVSGGCDSVCLLDSLVRYEDARKGKITVVHVHHSLSSNADIWANFVESLAQEHGLDFELCRVKVEKTDSGIEAEARRLRYEALEKAALKAKAEVILTAHHQDDQLETFLIQWVRGAGPDGLVGMPMLKGGKIPIGRPFLGLGRKDLEQYAGHNELSWVDDESNEDTKYLRNFIRLKILPQLDEVRPGYRAAANRSIELLSECVEILKETDAKDLAKVKTAHAKQPALDISKLCKLSQARQRRVLRLWLEMMGFPTLPYQRLVELQESVSLEKGSIKQLLQEETKAVICTDGLLLVTDLPKSEEFEFSFKWEGQGRISIPELSGTLIFKENAKGFLESWLRAEPLTVTRRKGKVRLKTKADCPPKLIKVLCQEAAIPVIERDNLPHVWRGDKLIFVGGLGEEIREKDFSAAGRRFSMTWQKDS